MNIPHAKYAADATMNDIARRLKLATWQNPLDPGEEAICERLRTDPDAARHLLTLQKDYKTWAIRMYLGGFQRTFGFTTDFYQGARFSDMIRVHFAKYKLRDAREPDTLDLNISIDRVRVDMMNEPEVVAIIHALEHHLRSIGAIMDPAEREAKRQEEIKTSRQKPTLRQALSDTGDINRKHFIEIEAKLEAMAKQIERVNSFIESLLVAARNPAPAFSPPPSPSPSPYTGDAPPWTPQITCNGVGV